MNPFIVTYDLKSPGRNYDSLIKAIKSYPSWCHISESCWCIVTSNSCDDIRDNLIKFIDTNDTMFLAGLTNKTAWYNLPYNVVEWLHNTLK